MARRFGSVEQLKSGRFRAYYLGQDGQRVRAPRTFDTEGQAQTWLDAERGDVIRGTWLAQRGGKETLTVYAPAWLIGRTDLKPRTVDLYARLIDLHILPTLGRYALRDLTPALVKAWHAKLGKSTGPTARAQSYRVLRAMLNDAIREKELTENPCQVRGGGTVQAPERVPPTIAQIEATAAVMPERHRMLVLTAAYSGLRVGELAALTRADVTVGEGVTLRVSKARHRIKGQWQVGTPKSDAGTRRVALPASLTADFADHLERFVGSEVDALVFCTKTGRMLATSNVSATLHKAQARAKVPPFRFHDLRHAGATLAMQSGATVKDVMSRIGHASPRAALIYSHTSSDRDQAIAAALDVARRSA
jgi:integrase